MPPAKKSSGMFAKDKEYGNRLDQLFGLNEPFILRAARDAERTISTEFGDAAVAELEVQRLTTSGRPSGQVIVASTVASAIVDKAREADDSDFPCVVELRRVKGRFRSDTLVVQWLGDWAGDRDGDAAQEATPRNDATATDDIPY